MAGPAVVQGDAVQGICTGHLVPGPLGVPVPGPPLPFTAPLTAGLATTVLGGGKPCAVVGSSGRNLPPHVGLHPADPRMLPPSQYATVTMGSVAVLAEGSGMAFTGCTVVGCLCAAPLVTGSAATVVVGT